MSPHLMFPLLALLLIALGWPLAARRVRPNRWYGLRVPATFPDETVRRETDAGVCAGILGLGSLLLAVRGWRLANRLLRQRRPGGSAAR